jgi:uncharacterized repeat protein (TIGR01451 family)
MRTKQFVRVLTTGVAFAVVMLGAQGLQSAQAATPSSAPPSTTEQMPSIIGPPGVAMQEPIAGSSTSPGARAFATPSPSAPSNASYTHTPAPNSGNDLPPGSGDIMPTTTIYFDFWLPTGQHYESDAAGDTNYENLLIQWANDLGSSQFHNLVTQYFGNNGTISNNVSFGGSWIDTGSYPHAGTTADPLGDSDIQTEVHNAVTTNGWTEDINHIVAVFTATGIHECMGGGSPCTFSSSNGFCAYHDHFTDGSNDAIYAFMAFDNFVHAAGKTCVAGQTFGDNDPNRGNYPNGDVNADAEINTLSHELTEAETDPHPNDTWTGPLSEIGDACNFNFAPRNDTGADVYLNGHGYIMQQEYSNAAHTCAVDLPTNGFCSTAVSNVCAPDTAFSKAVDNPNPHVLSTINYTLTLDNTSDTAADTNVAVTDSPPVGYTVTGISAPNSTTSSFTTTSVTVNYDTLQVHQTRTITVTATVPVAAGQMATNCGSLSGSDLLGTALTPLTSSPCASTTPTKIPTSLTYNGATTSDFNDAATVSAVLTDDAFNPLSGKQIDFTLNGTETCSAMTDGSGTASCPITPGEAAGSYMITAAFNDTSDPVYATTSTSAGFTVTHEETTTTYTGPTVILQGASGATLSGQLLEDGTTPIAGRTLMLSVGGQSCPGVTSPSGVASCNVTFTGPLGPEPLSAQFAGDGFYLPSSDNSKTAIVYAFPSRGAFTLGANSVASAGPSTDLTWWADTWPGLNALSSGVAPASFKGFAGTVTLPTTSPPSSCGSGWTTGPGNSPPPTSDVPSYMGVLVTGTVTKSGTVISGNTTHIVVVKIDPGYAPDPAHHGTGVIVATVC